ncbi:MAG: tRNA 2-selenouridine(34) synthase MnmH [Ferruginibacter sp.]
MPVKKLSIELFLQQASHIPVIDVRSPSEFLLAHIPGAFSIPLFSDEERKIVGTAYKQQSREHAIKYGVQFFGPKMKGIIEEAEQIFKILKIKNSEVRSVALHCWRGGMRSSAVAWLLDLYGFNVCLLEGGYKAYRNWVLQQFEKDYDLRIIGGYTGSGKTPVIHQLKFLGQQTIDLEAIANHKGSAFGALGQPAQPRSEMFENLLAKELSLFSDEEKSIWIEDESQRIGVLNIPLMFWKTMRTKPVYFINIPFEERLIYITQEYGCYEKEKIAEAIVRIEKRLGPLETKMALAFLEEDNLDECFRILLTYYDKYYTRALYNRENIEELLNKIPCLSVDAISNTEKILSCETVPS